MALRPGLLAAPMARGGSAAARRSRSCCQTPSSAGSASHPSPPAMPLDFVEPPCTRPVRTVVWEGRSRAAPPYPDDATALSGDTPPAPRLGWQLWALRPGLDGASRESTTLTGTWRTARFVVPPGAGSDCAARGRPTATPTSADRRRAFVAFRCQSTRTPCPRLDTKGDSMR